MSHDLVKDWSKLPAVAALGELWQQREGEGDPEYWAFLDWLDQAKRAAPPQQFMQAANTHQWAERAQAFDTAKAIQKRAATPGSTPWQRTGDSLSCLLEIEAAKLVKRAATSQEAVLSPKEMTAMVTMVAGIVQQHKVTKSAETDLSGFSMDEKRTILEAQRLLKRAGQK